MVRRGDAFRSVTIDYHDGIRQPHLLRIPGTPDRLAAILKAR